METAIFRTDKVSAGRQVLLTHTIPASRLLFDDFLLLNRYKKLNFLLHKVHRIHRLAVLEYFKVKIRPFYAVVFCRFA